MTIPTPIVLGWIVDRDRRWFDREQLEQLRFLARQVMIKLEERRGKPLA